MGGGGKAPKPSSEERQLQAAQTQTLNQQRLLLTQQLGEQELLAPYLYKQAGLKPIYDSAPGGKNAVQQYIETTGNTDFKNLAAEYMDRHAEGEPTLEGLQRFASGLNINQKDAFVQDVGGFKASGGSTGPGKITGFEEIKDEAQTLRERIELMQLQRSEAALRGDLPVDPALERSLAQEEQTLRDIMADRLGTGWETSTPGIEAMNDLRERGEELRYAARRDMMTTAEALALARQGAREQQVFGGTAAAGGQRMNIAQMFGQSAGGYGQAIQGYRGERMQTAQNKAATQSAMFGAGGAVVGTAAGVAIAM